MIRDNPHFCWLPSSPNLESSRPLTNWDRVGVHVNLRQGLGTVAVAAALGLVSLIAAPSASAAATGTIQDLGNGTVRVTYNAGGHIVDVLMCPAGTVSCVGPSRVYSISTASGSTPLGASPALIQEGMTVRPLLGGTTSLPAGNYVFSLVGTGGGSTFYPIDANVAVTIGSGGGGGSSDSTASSSTPSPIFQQFGKSSSGGCDAAAPATLNWSGVASGGWGESWAQWMNNGNGGAVCTRTLVYSTAQSRWVIA